MTIPPLDGGRGGKVYEDMASLFTSSLEQPFDVEGDQDAEFINNVRRTVGEIRNQEPPEGLRPTNPEEIQLFLTQSKRKKSPGVD